jgi:hypothetical protein
MLAIVVRFQSRFALRNNEHFVASKCADYRHKSQIKQQHNDCREVRVEEE